MKKWIAGLVLALMPIVASATTWYTFVSSQRMCITGSDASVLNDNPLFETPKELNNALKYDSNYRGETGYAFPTGVALVINMKGGGYVYFSTKGICEMYKHKYEKELHQLK